MNDAWNSLLRTRKTELEADQTAFLKHMGAAPASASLRRLIARYIMARTEDVRDQTVSPTAKKRLSDLDRAKEALDIPAALANGQLVPHPPDSQADMQVTMLFDFIARHRELAGLTKALAWLETFATSVANDGVIEVMHGFAHLGVRPCGHCDCAPEDIDDADRYPELAWLHAHHAEYNQAAWKILASKPGLIYALHQAIKSDIEGPSQRLGRRLYGEAIARSYAQELLAGFVRLPRPTARWVGRGSV